MPALLRRPVSAGARPVQVVPPGQGLRSGGIWQLSGTIRQGVKWSDGTPMSAADVAYTFNLIKKYPALDLTGVWSVLSGVTATGNTVTMDFSSAALPYFYYLADLTPMVPEHIWSKIANPTTAPVTAPVGTGPYLMSKCSPSNITYTANPHYWQPGLPKISKLEYPAFTSNDPANEMLASGQAQWGTRYIPDIEAYYASKSPDNHYWFPPTVNIALIPNLTNSLLSNVKIRQAGRKVHPSGSQDLFVPRSQSTFRPGISCFPSKMPGKRAGDLDSWRQRMKATAPLVTAATLGRAILTVRRAQDDIRGEVAVATGAGQRLTIFNSGVTRPSDRHAVGYAGGMRYPDSGGPWRPSAGPR